MRDASMACLSTVVALQPPPSQRSVAVEWDVDRDVDRDVEQDVERDLKRSLDREGAQRWQAFRRPRERGGSKRAPRTISKPLSS
jgi:hypothetical protein